MIDPDPDPTECRDCGQRFDLARQNYYAGRCPECVEDKRTWPRCYGCGDRVHPDGRETVQVRGAARDPSTVRLPSCGDCVDN